MPKTKCIEIPYDLWLWYKKRARPYNVRTKTLILDVLLGYMWEESYEQKEKSHD